MFTPVRVPMDSASPSPTSEKSGAADSWVLLPALLLGPPATGFAAIAVLHTLRKASDRVLHQVRSDLDWVVQLSNQPHNVGIEEVEW